MNDFRFVDLFCGGGGSITGAINALNDEGYPHLAEKLNEMYKEVKQEGLDKAAKEAATKVYTYTFQGMDDLIGLFKAGAEWMYNNMKK